MAAIEASYDSIDLGKGVHRYIWANVTEADECVPVYVSGAADRCLQAYGAWGSATLAVQGSLQKAPATEFFGLTGPDGNLVSLIADGAVFPVELTNAVKPVLADGISQDLTIILLVKA